MADNSKEQEWNKNESVPILHTTELEQEWNKNDFLEQKWNKNGPFLFNFRLQCPGSARNSGGFCNLASKKARHARMSLRAVLNSIKVSGLEKDVQVIQGMCPAPNGGWEVSFPETNKHCVTPCRLDVRISCRKKAGRRLVSISSSRSPSPLPLFNLLKICHGTRRLVQSLPIRLALRTWSFANLNPHGSILISVLLGKRKSNMLHYISRRYCRI